MLADGTYRLAIDWTPPRKKGRRRRRPGDWRSYEIKAGTLFHVVEDYDYDKLRIINRIDSFDRITCRVVNDSVRCGEWEGWEPFFAALVLLEDKPSWYLNRRHVSGAFALDILFKKGLVTMEDLALATAQVDPRSDRYVSTDLRRQSETVMGDHDGNKSG